MKKLILLSLILIVGCDNSTEAENNFRDVAWLIADGIFLDYDGKYSTHPIVYWTKGYKPETVFSGDTYSGPGVSIHFPVFVIDGDSTAINADSVKSITHITKEGYFAINEIYAGSIHSMLPALSDFVWFNSDTTIYFDNDEVFKYGYK